MMIKSKFLLLSLLLLSGCVSKEILDDIAIEIARGYDLIEDKKIQGTMLVYNFQPDKTIKNTTLSTTASTSRELANKLQERTPDPLAEGSLEVIAFGKDLANDGIIDYLDAPLRNASIGARVYLVVVDGSANVFLNGEYGARGNAIFISNLLKHNIENQNLPNTNLQLFFHDYYQLGKTGFLPRMKKIADDQIELNGISLFKSEKMKVADTIEPEKMFFFKLLVDKFSEGTHKINREEGEVVLRSLSSKNKLRLTQRDPYSVTVDIKIKGITREYTGPGKLSKKMIEKYEKEMEKMVSKECEDLIKRFIEKEIDPVGFGYFIKTKTRGFDFKKFEQQEYEKLNVKVNTDVKIVESGVIE